MIKWTIFAALCIVGIILGNWQRAREDENKCRSCRYNNMGDCTCDILCENYEMWEEK